jgi:hypothetical protein
MMRDDTSDAQTDGPAAEGGEPTPRGPRGRIEQRLGGRPLMVYVVLIAGAAALLLLLIIVWISAIDDDGDERPPCIDVRPEDALDMIEGGQVRSMDVYRDLERPEAGPSIIQVVLNDDTCHKLPEGANNRESLLFVVGAATYYNEYAEQQIDIRMREQALPNSLLVTSTPEPTEPPTATGTATARPASPTALPPTPTVTATPEPTVTNTPVPPPTTTPLPATPTSTPSSPQDQPAP